MSENTVKSTIGNIKKKFTTEDFNPFTVMEWVYDMGLSGGVGTKVSLVGFSERFKDHLVKSWWHVMLDRGIITNTTPPPIPVAGEFKSHTGAIISFIGMEDSESNHTKFRDICETSDIILLCSEYQAPTIRSISRFYNSTKSIYDFSKTV